MGRKIKTRSIHRSTYKNYLYVARHFYDAAKDAMDLEYWTAAGVLIVHSAIAFSDALCIQQGGLRSIAEDHEDAIELLEKIISITDDKTKALSHLRRIIEEKTKVSYPGELYEPKQTKELWKRLERFKQWVERILNTQ